MIVSSKMPSPINGYHQDETVKPENEIMGRENIQTTSARPTLVRQRSNVQKVEDCAEDLSDGADGTKPHKPHRPETINGRSETGQKSVHFANGDFNNGACGSDDGIDYRKPETPEDEETSLTDDKHGKVRQRQKWKKQRRQQWIAICSCGFFIFLVAAGALSFAVYSHVQQKQNPNHKHGVLFCYSCDIVKAEDIITYKEDYKMCCVGKDAKLKNSEVKASPLTAEIEGEKEKESHRVQFQEIGIDVARSEGEFLGFRMLFAESSNNPTFLHLTNTAKTEILIEESGLYMMTMTLTTRAPSSEKPGSYFRFMACLKFQNGNFQDDECRKITLLPNVGDPFEIHKTINLNKGTIIRATSTDTSFLERNVILNKMQIVQLHKS
ncbi:uncharacterized protein LOC127738538 [Mytilus californianus]|uniref:uncharacterized protein LOC127738538 n=1 Tax=Mytilus californianus TaxID=6549 RepID=UPI002247A129|nr:uncharacterized protein LOC127738538 [Mytilus californianus]